MTLLGDEFTIDGSKLDPDVTERVVGARLVGRDQGAMSLELSIWDGDWLLRREGKLASSRRPKKTPFKQASWARYGESRLILDGILFRFAATDVALGSPVVRITWDDEMAALMRRHESEIKVSRGSKSRAGIIGMATDRVKEIAIPYRSPEERIRQNVEPVEEDESEGKGFADGARLTIKGVKASREQLRNLTIALEVADRLRAGERATLALIAAGTTESRWINDTGGDRDSSGVLQVRQQTADGIVPRQVRDPRSATSLVPGVGQVQQDAAGPIAPGRLNPRDVKEVVRLFLLRGYWGKGGAIKLAADNPDMLVHMIAQNVQGSQFLDGSNYAPWVNEAEAILDAWGGTGTVTTLRESFEFQIGGKLNEKDQRNENHWAGVNRLGNELEGWQLWAWRNNVFFVSDEWLFRHNGISSHEGRDRKRRGPALRIGPEHVIPAHRDRDNDAFKPFWQIGHRADVGAVIQEVRIAGPSRRWDFAPGSTVLLDDLGDISGKWLLSEHDFDLQRDWLTATLRRPMEKQREPAPRVRSVTRTETRRQDEGSPRDKILDAARKAASATWKPFYRYSMTRPYPPTLFPATAGPHIILVDCSSFVTLVYKAAGIVDPNNLGYNGTGNTSTLRANGRKTSDPQPGDLVHYGTGAAGGESHVGIYSGDGKVIQIGGRAGVSELDVDYRSDLAGYWTHDLGDA